MENIKEVSISVRALIEFILRSGDIDIGRIGTNKTLEGIKGHKKVQKMRKEKATPLLMTEYESEVTLKHKEEYKEFIFSIEGRVDGIIKEKGKNIVIEEIKTTSRDLNLIKENKLHLAQAKCYAYIYSIQNKLNEIDIKITYFNLDTEKMKFIDKSFSIDELEIFFKDLIKRYYVWVHNGEKLRKERNESIKKTNFPFENYRDGQRKLAVCVYNTIAHNKNIFIQAPTGIGKTISTIFPSVKAMGEEKASKLFYLTAKTVTREFVMEAFNNMIKDGLKFKVVSITAKDKICFKEETNCNGKDCEYAKGHFDRVNEAIFNIINNEYLITEDVIKKYALKYKVCPFELVLDLSLWCDCVVCDYNYVFDPKVYLRRYFGENNKENFIFLVDEAHNLVHRSRNMYSSSINKKSFLQAKGKIGDKKVKKALNKINSYFIGIRKLCDVGNYYIQKEAPKDLYIYINQLILELEIFLNKNQSKVVEEIVELYFDCLHFVRIYELYNSECITYAKKNNDEVVLTLYSVDTSQLLKDTIKKSVSTIFFSATLSPVKYFRKILGGSEEDYILKLPSPFPKDNKCVLISNNISTKYKDREKSYERICDYIKTVCKNKKGNYMVFFPSYKYMNDVYSIYKDRYNDKIMIQSSSMSEESRRGFLDEFIPHTKETNIGFCVLGGVFSEGIDLKNDRMIGTIIVGVGLPKICLENDIVREYFEEKYNKGFEYAYMYPGMTKVLQAAGRVIRSEKDRGVIVLIDERFDNYFYKGLIPEEWKPISRVRNIEDINSKLNEFWNKFNR